MCIPSVTEAVECSFVLTSMRTIQPLETNNNNIGGRNVRLSAATKYHGLMIKQLLVCWMGVLRWRRWRGDAARSSYDESVIIRAMQQTQCMGSREIDSNHY